MRILIADDHAIVRKGLRQIAEESGRIEVGEAANGQEALEKVRGERWDALVLDINMPGRHGLEVLQAVKDFPAGSARVGAERASRRPIRHTCVACRCIGLHE